MGGEERVVPDVFPTRGGFWTSGVVGPLGPFLSSYPSKGSVRLSDLRQMGWLPHQEFELSVHVFEKVHDSLPSQ